MQTQQYVDSHKDAIAKKLATPGRTLEYNATQVAEQYGIDISFVGQVMYRTYTSPAVFSSVYLYLPDELLAGMIVDLDEITALYDGDFTKSDLLFEWLDSTVADVLEFTGFVLCAILPFCDNPGTDEAETGFLRFEIHLMDSV